MIEENFPLPIRGLIERRYTSYVFTKNRYKQVTAFSPMFGIDCEMCRTDSGELIMDYSLQVFIEYFLF